MTFNVLVAKTATTQPVQACMRETPTSTPTPQRFYCQAAVVLVMETPFFTYIGIGPWLSPVTAL